LWATSWTLREIFVWDSSTSCSVAAALAAAEKRSKVERSVKRKICQEPPGICFSYDIPTGKVECSALTLE
jgi:hypothetical protein